MLKFVVLSLLALGCHAVGHATVGAGYGAGVHKVGTQTYGAAVQSGQGAHHQSYGASYQGQAGHVAQPVASYQSGYGAQPVASHQAYGASYQGQAGHVAQPVASYQSGYGAQPVGANQQVIASRSYYTQPSVVNSDAAVQSYGLLRQYAGETRQDVVNAAVQQLGRTVEYKVVPYQENPIEAQVVEVEPSDIPLHIHFKTRSSSVSLSQSHAPGVAQEAQVSSSQDEPSRLVHEIQKPVIQEVREVITPYRQVTQEIQPVVEAVHTVVTKAEGQRAQYQGDVSAQYQSAGSQHQAVGNQYQAAGAQYQAAGAQYQAAGNQYQAAGHQSGAVGSTHGAVNTVSRQQSYSYAAPAVKPAVVSSHHVSAKPISTGHATFGSRSSSSYSSSSSTSSHDAAPAEESY